MRRRKSLKLDYANLTPIEVYECLSNGLIGKFPNGFVTKENIKEIIREVVLNRLKLSREDICNLSYEYLRRYNLGGSRRAFDDNIYLLITYCFPEMDIRYWELKKVETGFWEKEENRREFMLWLAVKEHINPSSVSDLKRIDAKMIQKYAGSKALKFGSGVFALILLIAKVEIKEWQVIKMRVWTDEKVKEAVRWMIEEKLKWSYEEVVQKISANVFYEYELGGMLCKHCNHSPIKALQIAYPGVYTKLRNVRPEYLKKA